LKHTPANVHRVENLAAASLVSVPVGLISGILPAHRAAHLNSTNALFDE
jgi:hypothetical protein